MAGGRKLISLSLRFKIRNSSQLNNCLGNSKICHMRKVLAHIVNINIKYSENTNSI